LTDSILYEFPLNERIRLFMRLENLFHEADYFLAGSSAWDSRAAMACLIEIVTMFARYDLKSELLKEIDRYNQVLRRLTGNPNVDEGKVAKILDELEDLGGRLYGNSGKLGQAVIEADLIKAVSQRSSMPGGSCSFDLPAFHFWLEQDGSKRRSDLNRWLEPFATVKAAVHLLMGFLRSSSSATEEVAQEGFYQKTLDHTLSFQLLRIHIARRYPCFAEISGGKHRFTVRMLTHTLEQKPYVFRDDVEFRLACCTIEPRKRPLDPLRDPPVPPRPR
jgi:cell division protein ZapD